MADTANETKTASPVVPTSTSSTPTAPVERLSQTTSDAPSSTKAPYTAPTPVTFITSPQQSFTQAAPAQPLTKSATVPSLGRSVGNGSTSSNGHSDSSRQLIDRVHPDWRLTQSMMLGIRTTLAYHLSAEVAVCQSSSLYSFPLLDI
jgi:hypothetical protein